MNPTISSHYSNDDDLNVAGIIRKAIWDRAIQGTGQIEELGL